MINIYTEYDILPKVYNKYCVYRKPLLMSFGLICDINSQSLKLKSINEFI